MTEKQYAPTKLNKKTQKVIKDTEKGTKLETPIKKEEKIKEKEIENPVNENQKKEEQEIQTNVKHLEDKKTEIKKPAKKIKKEEVCVNAQSVPVSTKYAINICKFIKGKRIGDAIRDLNQVVLLKKAVPMKGEYSHRKGKGMSGGAFPQRASKHFIILLKSLAGNANNHEIDEPFITEAIANWAPAPKGKFGRIRRKRTHITLKAREMKIKENKKEKKK